MLHHIDHPFLQTLGRNALEEIQLKKFQTMLGPILENNAFYSAKLKKAGISSPNDIKSLEDYRRIPFTTKQELSADQAQTAPYGTNLTFPLEKYTRIHQTSGTTGEPLRCLDTEESWQWWARCWETIYRSAGVTSEDRIFFAFSFGPFIGFWSAHAGAQRVGALAIPGGGMSSLQRLKFILKNEVTILVCTPTYALHLAEVAEEEGIDLSESKVRITIHAGEPGAGLPSTRARIEEAWGVKCFDHAGATEVGAWGYEDIHRDGLYVNEAEFMFDVVDPVTGDVAEEGELIITNLGRAGMPVIRYKTGDRVRIASTPSGSGSTFRRLEGGVIGRIDDAMIVRGINVFPSAIENMVRRFSEVGEFAVDVYRFDELDEMEIRVEINKGAPEDVAHAVAQEIRSVLTLRAKVTPVPFGSLPRFDLKARRFSDHRSRATEKNPAL